MIYTLLFFLVLMLVLNFGVVRPYRKTFNKRAIMLNSVRVGTVVYTVDGVRGEVASLNKDVLKLKCSPDRVILFLELEQVDRIENYDEKTAKYLMDEKMRKGRERFKKQR